MALVAVACVAPPAASAPDDHRHMGKPLCVLVLEKRFPQLRDSLLNPCFKNCVLLRCSLWLFRFWGKSFFPDPAGTRSETWPRRPRAGF